VAPRTGSVATDGESVTEPDRVPEREAWAAVAGACAIVAGVAHLSLAPAHFTEAWYLGVFFAGTGVAQVGLAVALRWTLPTWVLQAAVAGHLTLIALYVASRTTELPFVPPHDPAHAADRLPVPGGVGEGVPVFPGSRIEEVAAVDLVCLVAELALVVALTVLLPRRAGARLATLMAILGVLAVAARTTGLLS
jgi:hypothetical protein